MPAAVNLKSILDQVIQTKVIRHVMVMILALIYLYTLGSQGIIWGLFRLIFIPIHVIVIWMLERVPCLHLN